MQTVNIYQNIIYPLVFCHWGNDKSEFCFVIFRYRGIESGNAQGVDGIAMENGLLPIQY
jgi:hypothetical protein